MENRKIFPYLWVIHSWWICNCSDVKEVLEYKGTILLVCRWVQELLVYHFTIVHRSKKMMLYVDALTRRFLHLISHYIDISALLSYRNRSKSPRAYDVTKFSNLDNVNIT